MQRYGTWSKAKYRELAENISTKAITIEDKVVGATTHYHAYAQFETVRSKGENNMKNYILQVSQNYLLLHKTRSKVIKALCMGLLPPRRMLSDDANIEIGYLILIGMISSDLINGYHFQGKFWEQVAFSIISDTPIIKKKFDDQGLELEILINSSGFRPGLCEDLEFSYEEGKLAEAFAQHIYCSRYMPDLVIPISDFLVESLGRIGLRILLSKMNKMYINVSAKKLSEQILSRIGIRS